MEEENRTIQLQCPLHKKNVILVNPDDLNIRMFLCAKCIQENQPNIKKDMKLLEFDEFMNQLQENDKAKLIKDYQDILGKSFDPFSEFQHQIQVYDDNLINQQQKFRLNLQNVINRSNQTLQNMNDRFDRIFEHQKKLFDSQIRNIQNIQDTDICQSANLLNFNQICNRMMDIEDEQEKQDFLQTHISKKKRFKQAGEDIKTLAARQQQNNVEKLSNQLQNMPMFDDFDRLNQHFEDTFDNICDKVFQKDMIMNLMSEKNKSTVVNINNIHDFMLIQNEMLNKDVLLKIKFDVKPDNLNDFKQHLSQLTNLHNLYLDFQLIKLNSSKEYEQIRQILQSDAQLKILQIVNHGSNRRSENIQQMLAIIPLNNQLQKLKFKMVNQQFGNDSFSENFMKQFGQILDNNEQIENICLNFSLNMINQKVFQQMGYSLNKMKQIKKLKINLELNSELNLKLKPDHQDIALKNLLDNLELVQLQKLSLNLNSFNLSKKGVKVLRKFIIKQKELKALKLQLANNHSIRLDSINKLVKRICLKMQLSKLHLNLANLRISDNDFADICSSVSNNQNINKLYLNVRSNQLTNQESNNTVTKMRKEKQKIDINKLEIIF